MRFGDSAQPSEAGKLRSVGRRPSALSLGKEARGEKNRAAPLRTSFPFTLCLHNTGADPPRGPAGEGGEWAREAPRTAGRSAARVRGCGLSTGGGAAPTCPRAAGRLRGPAPAPPPRAASAPPSLSCSFPPSRGAPAAAAALRAGRSPAARSHLLSSLARGGRDSRSSGKPGGATAQPRRSSLGTGRPAPHSPPCPSRARSPPSRDGIVAAARTQRGSRRRRRRRRPSGAPCFPPTKRSIAPPIRSR